MDVLGELRKVGYGLSPKAEPIPISMNDVGIIGHVDGRQGVYINSGIRHHVKALLKDHYRAEQAARELSNGSLGAHDILPIVGMGSDSRDAIKAIKSMKGAITSWDSVINARQAAKAWDYMGTKASVAAAVTNNWYSSLRAAGNPQAMTGGAIPGPTAIDSASTGAWPLPMSLGATENLYMTNFGVNHQTGTNVVLVVDVLQNAGSITATIVTAQNVSTTTNLRWTTDNSLQMILEVTTAFGTATGVPNVTVNYTNESGTASRSTGAISIGTTNYAAAVLFPRQDGVITRLQAGDVGVRSIQQVTFSASSAGAGAACAAIIYKPLLLVPTLATTTYVERSTPAQIGGIRLLTSNTQGSKAAIGFFVLVSGASTGIQTYMIETVWG